MTTRTIVVIVLALVCGGSAAVGVKQLSQPISAPAAPDVVEIVVATMDISRGGTITGDLVRSCKWPKDMVPPGAMSRVEDAVDRSVLLPVVMGEPVLDAKLAPRDAGRGIAALITKGMRAFTINTPTVESGVAGFILPGNNVDVLLTIGGQATGDFTGGASTTTLLQNVEILAVDQRLDAPAENKMDPKTMRSVTLLVTPDQAAKLSLGQTKGTLHLSLRNLEDSLAADTQPVTLADLRFRQEAPVVTEAHSAPESAPDPELPPPPAILQIRTLRGTQSGVVLLEQLRTSVQTAP